MSRTPSASVSASDEDSTPETTMRSVDPQRIIWDDSRMETS